MARAHPAATVTGSDHHPGSVEQAGKRAGDAGLTHRVSSEVATAADFPGRDDDLVTVFDALHDMPDPLGAARHARESLPDDGVSVLVEPFAGDRLEDDPNPEGRPHHTASTAICVAHSRTAPPATALGARAGEARLTALLHEAGSGRVRRAASTPFDLVLEARP
jgi:methyltransferase family protein